jgi:hypothetical protein
MFVAILTEVSLRNVKVLGKTINLKADLSDISTIDESQHLDLLIKDLQDWVRSNGYSVIKGNFDIVLESESGSGEIMLKKGELEMRLLIFNTSRDAA